MATDSISGGNKSHARRVQYQQEVVSFNYNITLCVNKIVRQGLSCCHGKWLPWASGEIQLLSLSFASASYYISPAALGSGL